MLQNAGSFQSALMLYVFIILSAVKMCFGFYFDFQEWPCGHFVLSAFFFFLKTAVEPVRAAFLLPCSLAAYLTCSWS